MWSLHTAVESLALPTDSVGRTTLTGTVTAWHHVVRETLQDSDNREAISAMSVRWSMWAWQQHGRRVQLHDRISAHESLADMVRTEPFRACILARYPNPGKRQSDNTIELVIVVPPEQFDRYESLVQFAMTLPSGHLSLTIPSPFVQADDNGEGETRRLITPGTISLMEGLEMVVTRGKAEKVSRADLRRDRRARVERPVSAQLMHDDGDDWLLFAAEKRDEEMLEDSVRD
ncbi:MAG: hypothetical protein ACO1Q7_18555 [Gemmatimonas sp.]